MAVITLLTDFGTRDGYVAAMKGVILGIAPEAVLVDVTHEVAPQDVAEAAFTLATCWRYFPPGTVHLVVVDPGVGSERRAVAVSAGGHYFVAPDNGVLSMALSGAAGREAVAITRRFRPEVSSTFHGRDVFAPAVAHLALGLPLAQLGPRVEELVSLPLAEPRLAAPDAWEGAVVAVDRFGNLITNVPAALLQGRRASVTICGCEVGPVRDHYAEVPAGDLLALVGSAGYLEVAENGGSAARRLGAQRGTPFRIVFTETIQGLTEL